MPDCEVLYNLPEEQYHAETGYGDGRWLTRSMLLDYQEHPRGFYLRHVLKHPLATKTWNAGMGLGSVVDAMLCGDDDRIVPVPDEHLTPSGNLSTKAATVAWMEEQDQAGRIVADETTLAKARLICDETKRHPIAERLIERITHHQVTLRWTDPKTGLRIQTRPDFLADGFTWGDYKTTRKPLHQFMSAVDEHGYDLQQVMAMDGAAACGLDPMPFCFLVMQNEFPYDVGVLRLQQRVVENAYARLHRTLAGISAEQWGSADTDLRDAPVGFWWTAKREDEVGTGVAS